MINKNIQSQNGMQKSSLLRIKKLYIKHLFSYIVITSKSLLCYKW